VKFGLGGDAFFEKRDDDSGDGATAVASVAAEGFVGGVGDVFDIKSWHMVFLWKAY
jgi:hypothetical protein